MTENKVTESIQDRCPRMREHMSGGCACHPKLPIPCPDCYSVRVTSERIPWQKAVTWHYVKEAPDD